VAKDLLGKDITDLDLSGQFGYRDGKKENEIDHHIQKDDNACTGDEAFGGVLQGIPDLAEDICRSIPSGIRIRDKIHRDGKGGADDVFQGFPVD